MSNTLFIIMAVAMLVLWLVIHQIAHLFVAEFGILAAVVACVVMYLSAMVYERGRHWWSGVPAELDRDLNNLALIF
jgi:hypothetical protein